MFRVMFFVYLLSSFLFSIEITEGQGAFDYYKEKGVVFKQRIEEGEPQLFFDASNCKDLIDEDLEYLKYLKLTKISLDNTNITDSALIYIYQESDIKILSLASTRLTNKSLIYINKMKNLESLDIQNTNIDIHKWPSFDEYNLKSLNYLKTTRIKIGGNYLIKIHIMFWSTGVAPASEKYYLEGKEELLEIFLNRGEYLDQTRYIKIKE